MPVALGQAVQLLQQLPEVILFHSSIHEAGAAPQVEFGEFLGKVSQGPVQG